MSSQPQRIVLSVAGSDPSGGAGIQADLKTLAMVGVYGAAAITCLTVQNTKGVHASHPVDASVVREQVSRVLEDMPVSHVKTGMIGNAAIARAVGGRLENFTGEVICDPVLRASSGPALLETTDLEAFKEEIIGRATVLTPNLDELALLSGCPCRTPEELQTATAILFAAFPRLRAIIAKGGHFQPDCPSVIDSLFLRHDGASPPKKPAAISCRQRIPTTNTHGTGCTMAAAYAGYHLLTGNDQQAFTGSTELIDQLLRKSAGTRMGAGTGPLLHHLFDRKV